MALADVPDVDLRDVEGDFRRCSSIRPCWNA